MFKQFASKRFIAVCIMMSVIISIFAIFAFAYLEQASASTPGQEIVRGGAARGEGLRVYAINSNWAFGAAAQTRTEGQWYAEIHYAGRSGNTQFRVQNIDYWLYHSQGGNAWRWQLANSTTPWTTLASQSLALGAGDVIGIALDATNNQVRFFRNGVLIRTEWFRNFNPEMNLFSIWVATGNSPTGSFDATFALSENDFRFAPPTGYLPWGHSEKPIPPTLPGPDDHLFVHLYAGSSQRLSLTGNVSDNLDFTWESSNTSIANVSADGFVTGLSVGYAEISALSSSGVRRSVFVMVDEAPPIPQPTLTKHNDNVPAVRYSGSWVRHVGPEGFYQGDQHFSNHAGAYAEFTFTGTGVRYIGALSENLGKSAIYLNGVYMGTIDAYAPTLVAQQVLWSVSGLENGQHILRIVVLNQRNPLASDSFVTVDAFVVES